MSVDPVNPQILYTVTGNGGNGVGFEGCGLFRSPDGGNTWSQFAFNDSWVDSLVILPSTAGSLTSTTLLASSQFGIYRSTDSGATFKVVMPGAYTSLVISLGSESTLYAGSALP